MRESVKEDGVLWSKHGMKSAILWWRKDDTGNESYVVTGHLDDGATSIGLWDGNSEWRVRVLSEKANKLADIEKRWNEGVFLG